LIVDVVKVTLELDRPLSVCGELAGDPKYIPKLLELGIHSVSVSPRLIPKVRLAVSG